MGAVQGLADVPGVFHYSPKDHVLERRCEIQPDLWGELMDRLPSEIKRLKEQLQTENMILQAHPQIKHGLIVKVVDIARAQGLQGIAFAREN